VSCSVVQQATYKAQQRASERWTEGLGCLVEASRCGLPVLLHAVAMVAHLRAICLFILGCIHRDVEIYLSIIIYLCVCVCVCAYVRACVFLGEQLWVCE